MLGKLNTLPLKHALRPERKTQKCDNNVLADDRVIRYNKIINKSPKTIQNNRYQELERLSLKTLSLFLTVYFKIVGLDRVCTILNALLSENGTLFL